MRTVTLYRIYTNIEELVVDYESGNLDSADVKQAFEKAMNRILQVTAPSYVDNLCQHHLLISGYKQIC
jgi:hypothetical protein